MTTDNIVETSHFCISRSCNPRTDEPYPGVNPSIYEVKLNVNRFAIFPTELSLYQLQIRDNAEPFLSPPGELDDLHKIRKILSDHGYDGIYLLREGTFSAIKSDVVEIVKEHDPLPIYNKNIRPELIGTIGSDPFPWVPE